MVKVWKALSSSMRKISLPSLVLVTHVLDCKNCIVKSLLVLEFLHRELSLVFVTQLHVCVIPSVSSLIIWCESLEIYLAIFCWYQMQKRKDNNWFLLKVISFSLPIKKISLRKQRSLIISYMVCYSETNLSLLS